MASAEAGGVPIIRKHGNVHVVCEKLFTYKLDKIYGKTFGPKHKSGLGRVHLPRAAAVVRTRFYQVVGSVGDVIFTYDG